MKSLKTFGLLAIIIIAFGISALAQIAVTGSTGADASYTTLKGAFDAINLTAQTGNTISIAVSGDTTETAPAVLNAGLWTSITISPTGGAARTISGAIVAGSPLVDLNGADNVTINGLNTGGDSLTIANTTVSATTGTSTIRFILDATNNTITNSNIQGSANASVATNGANIFFSTGTTTGNDNNTISNNNIGPAGANLPTKTILGNGSTGTTAVGNSGNIINNNNIFDYFGAAVTSAGVATNGGCNTWSITNNRFYQTGTRTWTTGALHNAINVGGTTATSGAQGFTITGNIVGFASNTQTGTYTLTGSTGTFRGIVFAGISGGTVSNINNNTIASVSVTGVTSSGTSSGAPFMGIFISNGPANTNNNTIGSQSATGSLNFATTSASAADVIGMFNFGVDAWTANSNNVGGITAANAGAGAANAYGLRLNTSGTVITTLTGNTVGGTVANSIQSTSTATGAQVAGIFVSTSITTATSNTIRNLTNAGGTGTTTAASVAGIVFASATPINTASQNTIFNLSNTNATAASVVTGIQFTGATGNVVERNLIHSLTTATNSATAELNGIRVAGGTTVYRNNMIAVGAGIANAIGGVASNSTTLGINGINESLGTNQFFHNSVYIGGSPTAGIGGSYAFNGTQTVNTRSFRDNIFFNARSNSGATGKNYAVKINGTVVNPTGLTINNNVYFANGTGAFFGFYNSLDVANIAAWKVAVGQDVGSFESNPQYLDPTNAVPDLHLSSVLSTVAEGNGADVGVVLDFDGQTRSGLTPVDIGADAGNFTGIDLSAPVITYTALLNTSSTANRIVPVTITDVTGVATGGVAPRIYYRKNAGAYFSTACSLSGGTVNSGVWDCTIDNAMVGGVVPTDVIGYFVVAQDTLGNLAANPSAGFVGTNVNTVTTPPTTPNTYTIVAAISGSFNVGTGETFTSLTNTGGIFEAINAAEVTGNVVINLTTDLTGELGTVALNEFASPFTILIKPSGAARTITGTNVGALIRLNGADRVRIDGSTAASVVGGNPALRELTIQNTNVGTATAVISIGSNGTNGATNNTIQNVNVLGQDPLTTLIGISIGGVSPGTAATGPNNNNRIQNCTVKRAIFGIFSSGVAATPTTGTVITQNDISATTTDRVSRVGIVVFNENGIQITENSVGGLSITTSNDAVGIGVGTQAVDTTSTTAGGVTNALVSRNKVNGVASLSTTGFSAVGIAVAGTTGGANVIANNMITGVTAPATSPDIAAGIYVIGSTGSNTKLYYNSVSMTGDRGVVAGQTPSYGIAITGGDPTVELKNNIFYTTQIASGGGVDAKSYGIGMVTTTFANLDSNNNAFFSTGANDGGFRSGSLTTAAGTEYATLALWSAAVVDDVSSVEGDPLFVNPLSDLHILYSTVLVRDKGVAVSVLDDFDGGIRSLVGFAGGIPDIGADEALAPTAATATVRGRLLTPTGRGLMNAYVDLTNTNTGEIKRVRSTSLGYFNFQDLPTGNFYIISVQSKRYQFNTQSFTLDENLDGLVLTANDGQSK
jgi:trimeric autotransporter adhesin